MDGYNPANTLRREWGFIAIIIKIIIITHWQRVIVRLLKLLTPAGFSQGSDMFLSPIEQVILMAPDGLQSPSSAICAIG